MSEILKYINDKKEFSVYASDIINGKLFHILDGKGGTKVAVFSDGSYVEIDVDSKTCEGIMEVDGKFYTIKNPLIKPDNDISRPNDDAIVAFANKEVPNKEVLYSKLFGLINDYYDFYEENEAHFVATNIIHSYILGALGRCFYLMLDGEAGTGKSSLQTTISELQYNGVFAGKTTAAALVRDLDAMQVSLNIDELDKISEDERKNITGILNTGYTKNGSYKITNMSNKDVNKQVVTYKTYGTKSFSANKNILDKSLASRCISINTVANTREVQNIQVMDSDQKQRFQDMRNNLFIYCLFNWKGIIKDIDVVKDNLKKDQCYGRTSDIFSIIGGIYRHFTGEDSICEVLKERADFELEMSLDDDRRYHTYKYILETIDLTQEYTELNATDIANYINEKIDIDQFDKYKATPKSVGKSLKSFRLVDASSRSVKVSSGSRRGSRVWVVKTNHIANVLLRSGYRDIKDDIKTSLDTLDTCHNATQQPLCGLDKENF